MNGLDNSSITCIYILKKHTIIMKKNNKKKHNLEYDKKSKN